MPLIVTIQLWSLAMMQPLLHWSYASIVIYCYMLKQTIWLQLQKNEFFLFRKKSLQAGFKPGTPITNPERTQALDRSAMAPHYMFSTLVHVRSVKIFNRCCPLVFCYLNFCTLSHPCTRCTALQRLTMFLCESLFLGFSKEDLLIFSK